MALVLSEVIMENFDDPFGSGFKGQGLYLVFISRGRFSIMLKISLRTTEEGHEDEDGYVIGYTHRGGGIIVVLKT